ncbi:lanthionine synthetase C family protein [Ascidiimonas sp. W6]|uniref:lanthionine synthetase C family protein n=1 Tax=Ascidiimonas meishanensis TaxID=3128903 RepID=UPI0030ED5BFE
MILPDSLKEKIVARISIIEDFLEGPTKDLLHHEKLSLYSGRPGMLIARAIIARKNNSEIQKLKVQADLDFIIQELQEASFVITPFASGIAGIGFAMEQIQEYEILNEDLLPIIDEIDDTVASDVENLISKSNYDLLHGVVGLGVCLIRKQKFEEAIKIIAGLSAEAIRTKKEIKWKRFDKLHTQKNIYDLGFAHGNAGILFFLGFAYRHDLQKELCKELITGLFSFYDNNIQNLEETGSFFAYSYDAESYESKKKGKQHSRLAWCYGDLGTLVTLIRVALWLDDLEKAKHYEQLLERTLGRRDQKDVKVVDACFCHGSAGNAFLYKHAYTITGNSNFKDEALYWISNTLKMADDSKTGSGYNFLVGTRDEDPYQNDFPGLLEGFLGVYLVLESFINNEEKLVKELFFLG